MPQEYPCEPTTCPAQLGITFEMLQEEKWWDTVSGRGMLLDAGSIRWLPVGYQSSDTQSSSSASSSRAPSSSSGSH
jgi:hypothetical protein